MSKKKKINGQNKKSFSIDLKSSTLHDLPSNSTDYI